MPRWDAWPQGSRSVTRSKKRAKKIKKTLILNAASADKASRGWGRGSGRVAALLPVPLLLRARHPPALLLLPCKALGQALLARGSAVQTQAPNEKHLGFLPRRQAPLRPSRHFLFPPPKKKKVREKRALCKETRSLAAERLVK